MIRLTPRMRDRSAENAGSGGAGAGLQVDVHPEIECRTVDHARRFAVRAVVQAPDGGREDVTGGEAGKRMPGNLASGNAKGVKSADFAGILRAERSRPVGECAGWKSAVK